MLKKLVAVGLVVCLGLFSMCACSNGDKESTDSGSQVAQEQEKEKDSVQHMKINFLRFIEPEGVTPVYASTEYGTLKYEADDYALSIMGTYMANPRTFEEHIDGLYSTLDDVKEITLDGHPAIWIEDSMNETYESKLPETEGVEYDCAILRVNTVVKDINMVDFYYYFKDGSIDENDRALVQDLLNTVNITDEGMKIVY